MISAQALSLPTSAVWLLAAAATLAQAPPSTEVYLAEIVRDEAGLRLGEPVNVTAREGYDNQPCFLPDGHNIVYTAIGEDGQADIWAYDLESKERRRVTETPESEYSPTPIPGEDAISVVRVEADQRQRLWRFPLDGGEPDLLLPDVEPVGYHVWSDEKNLALFVLGEPNTLQSARRGPGPAKHRADDIGRALHRVPESTDVTFVLKGSEGGWTIQQIDLSSGTMKELIATRPGREDYTWSPTGELWMGDGAVLYVAAPEQGRGWVKVADLTEAKLSDITRIAIHPKGDLVAFVAVPAADQTVPADD